MTPPAATADGLHVDDRGIARCGWCAGDPLYVHYHDREWGRPLRDDRRLFEKLCLEAFQCGLSWITILRKREAFREAFVGFEIETVARFRPRDVARLLGNPEIVRHRGKIEATIANARRAREVGEAHGSLAAYLWSFAPAPEATPPPPRAPGDVPARTEASTALARDLKRRGWRFVGPTTAYAFMQSVGMINDHLAGCATRTDADAARARFRSPAARSPADNAPGGGHAP